MKLFKISQSKCNGYDTYDSAVVAASSFSAARKQHPSGDNNYWNSSCWVSDPRDVTAEYLGEAKAGTKTGVICSSFNAG